MTGLTPEESFKKHKKGERANSFVEHCGIRLLPKSLYVYANPMPYEAAREMDLAIGLREEGYEVWQGQR